MARDVCDPADRGGAAYLRLVAKSPMSAMPGMHHDMSMMAEHVGHHGQSSSMPMPVDHGEACGYCVLLTHVPGLMLALVILLSGMLLRQS